MPTTLNRYRDAKQMRKTVSGSLTCCDTDCSRPASSPPRPFENCVSLLRARSNLVQERSRQINRVQKVLETANIKLAAVVTDILGKSSRQMIEALLDGQTDPTTLAQLARSRLRTKIPQLSLALEGHLDDHHILL